MSVPHVDQAAWRRLSPLLDELLLLTAPQRQTHLDALRSSDAALADELCGLLNRLPQADAAGFLAAPAWPVPVALAGVRVGAYQLARELGQGGMGSVWLAHRADGLYEAQVAVKFMHGCWMGRGAAERFRREGQLLARLDHPHIARLIDAGVMPADAPSAGQPFLVLEYVDGQPIDRWCDDHALPLQARVRLMQQVCVAVAHAHQRAILHRDLKPSNILVTPDGRPKLLDFGVGKLLADADSATSAGGAATDATQFTHVAFTARFAAPEQVQGQSVTPATDVYALGVLLYGLLGGGHPTEVEGGTPLAQLQAVVEAPPPRLSTAVLRRGGRAAARQAGVLRGDLDAVVAKALHKSPAQRYADADALAADLQRWLDASPVQARRQGRGRIGRLFDHRIGHDIGHLVRRPLHAAQTRSMTGTLARMVGAVQTAWRARQAGSRRVQAGALMDFMVGDLQARISHLGHPQLLLTVGEQALACYAGQDLLSLDAAALAQRAAALRMVGEGARLRMDMAQARAALEEAARTTARLAALAPDDRHRLQDHIASVEHLVYLTKRTLDMQAMLTVSRQVSTLRRRVAALAPHDAGLQLMACEGDQWLAWALVHCSQEADGLALLGQVEAGLRQLQACEAPLPAGCPPLQRLQAVNAVLTGMALSYTGRYAQAQPHLRAFLAPQPGQPGAPQTVHERRENLTGTSVLADTLLSEGQLAACIGLLQRALIDAQTDADQRQDNLLLAEQVVRFHVQLGQALAMQGELPLAREHLRMGELRLQRVHDEGGAPADDMQWHVRTLGEVLALRARLQPAGPEGLDAASVAAFDAHARHVAGMDARGWALHGAALGVVLAVELAHGDALQAGGQAAAARQRWQTAAQRARPAAAQGLHVAMQHLALALLRLGRPDEAADWVEQLADSTWRHPDLHGLQQALASCRGAPVQAAGR